MNDTEESTPANKPRASLSWGAWSLLGVCLLVGYVLSPPVVMIFLNRLVGVPNAEFAIRIIYYPLVVWSESFPQTFQWLEEIYEVIGGMLGHP